MHMNHDATYPDPHHALLSCHTLFSYVDSGCYDPVRDPALESTRRFDAHGGVSSRAFVSAKIADSALISGALPSEVWG